MKEFFSPTTWQAQREPQLLVPECGKCRLLEHCHSPKMPVSGKGRKRVLILAEAPGENEDRKGIQLVGNAGMELVKILFRLDINMRRDCWLTNALICRPKDEDGGNRKPTPQEIGFCRPNLAKTLYELKPDVIIPLGEVAIASLIALAWKDKEVKNAGSWVGWDIPSIKLNSWICPTFHPSYLLRNKVSAVGLLMRRHLRAAFKHNSKPWNKKPDWKSKIKLIYNHKDVPRLVAEYVVAGKPIAFDYETTTLKPDGPHAAILCCSISDGVTAIAYPWIGDAITATQKMIRSDVPKVAANVRFEERWTWKEFGHGVRNWHWDTLLGAHWNNCHPGICSLKFQSFVLLGAEDYDSHIESYRQSKDGNSNSPNRMIELEPTTLLTYCGLDSLFEILVAQKQGMR